MGNEGEDDDRSGTVLSARSAVRLSPVVHARELFGEAREVVIVHGADRYRLRITRSGKLILNK